MEKHVVKLLVPAESETILKIAKKEVQDRAIKSIRDIVLSDPERSVLVSVGEEEITMHEDQNLYELRRYVYAARVTFCRNCVYHDDVTNLCMENFHISPGHHTSQMGFCCWSIPRETIREKGPHGGK